MKIILSQRIDIESDYDDIPFITYHFPKRYLNQIHSGDRFIYYQGNRHKREHRYYFGCGVIGDIKPASDGINFFANIVEGHRFGKKVPIYQPDETGFIESIGYEQIRSTQNPSWQSSIRKISDRAYSVILNLAEVDTRTGEDLSDLEKGEDALEILRALNYRYSNLKPDERTRSVQNLIDRGSAITRALKAILGSRCQICGWEGFTKRNGDDFIEAHHIDQLAEKRVGSLCTENIILVCPNCHSEIHYGNNFQIKDQGNYFEIYLSK